MSMIDIGQSQERLESFSKYWLDTEPAIKLYLHNVIFNASDVPDVLQRVALCAFRKFDSFDRTKSFQGWVIGIAKFEVLGYLRDHGRRNEVVDSEVVERVRENMDDWNDAMRREHEDRVDQLCELLETMPVKTRELVRLRYYEGLSFLEIGKRFGMSEGAVRTALSRIVLLLRNRVRKSGMEEA